MRLGRPLDRRPIPPPAIRILFLACLWFLVTGCREPAPISAGPQHVAQPSAATAAVPAGPFASPTSLPTVTLTAPASRPPAITLPTETTIALPSPEPPPTATPEPTPNPYADLTISALAGRPYGGGQIDIIDTMLETETFTRYLVTYPSDGLTIYGYLNVPNEGDKFPVVLLLHGYIDPDEYDTVAYTERYATSLVEAGYMVIHPNFRNYPPSDSGPDPYRTGYAIDVLNLIAIIREQSQDPFGYLRRADADHIHLWGHSMGGGVALRVIAVNNAEYIRAAVLYGSMSGNEIWNYEQIRIWSNRQRGEFELTASPEMQEAISPIYHLDRIRAAVSIHHSIDDQQVPVSWSEDLCRRLEDIGHPVECFFYEGLPHTFNGWGDSIFMERVIDFFGRY